MKRYFIKKGEEPYKEVTKKRWVASERAAGFHQTKGGSNDEPATGSFYSSNAGFDGKSIEGTLTSDSKKSIKYYQENEPQIATLLQHPPVLLEE